jgi:biofilm PGA synthesis N-glycosyltransferase PgaC
VENPRRLGKSEAVNRGVLAARQPVVVLTDANATLAPGALKALARHFDDPSVAGVAGEKRVDDDGGGQKFYWRFESWLKLHESRTGTTVGLVGELAAFRRERFRPLPIDIAVDDLWLVLDLIEGGGRVIYDPTAVAYENGSQSPRAEWERRTRMVDGALDVLWRRRRMLSLRGSPVAGQLWGHRAVRSSAGPVAHLFLLLISLRTVSRSRLAVLFAAGHVVGLLELARWLQGKPSFKPARFIAHILFLQGAGIGGLVRYLRGDRPALWPKPERPTTFSGLRPPPNSSR